ncbi:MAG: hypothetical protein ACE364_08530 [Chlorobiota bacterium]
MTKKSRIIKNILLFLILTIPLNYCGDIAVDVEETKKRGDRIVKALDSYYEDFKEYPQRLELLVPYYLDEIPNVANHILFPFVSREFQYGIHGYIPKYGYYSITYCTKEGIQYRYDTRASRTFRTLYFMNNPEWSEVNIEHKDIEIITKAINSYYWDNRRYPDSLEQLIPDYLTEFPIDINALYKPPNTKPENYSRIVDYKYSQPSDAVCDEYQLLFDVGWYDLYKKSNSNVWIYDD